MYMLLNKTKTNAMALFIMAITISSTGCYNDKEELLYPGRDQPNSCASIPASFKSDVLPIIKSKCAVGGCHDETAAGGYVWETFEQISKEKDRIFQQAIVLKRMPKGGPPLPIDESNKLRCWIDNGAQDN
jgi:uncharacterized membrane protein